MLNKLLYGRSSKTELMFMNIVSEVKMKIKDIKAGGWVRYTFDNAIELGKVRDFRYDKGCANGYCFYLEGRGYGLSFERKDFKYSDNVAGLIRKGERVMELKKRYFICNSFTKDEFVKKFGGEE